MTFGHLTHSLTNCTVLFRDLVLIHPITSNVHFLLARWINLLTILALTLAFPSAFSNVDGLYSLFCPLSPWKKIFKDWLHNFPISSRCCLVYLTLLHNPHKFRYKFNHYIIKLSLCMYHLFYTDSKKGTTFSSPL